MSVTYSWKINSLAVSPVPVDGSDDVIVQISASRIATDGDQHGAGRTSYHMDT
jgi:hypothetical protein